MNNDWISVKDKLPEFNKEVLVMKTNGFGLGEFISKTEFGESFRKARDCGGLEWFTDYTDMKFITHWIPLPEKPNV